MLPVDCRVVKVCPTGAERMVAGASIGGLLAERHNKGQGQV